MKNGQFIEITANIVPVISNNYERKPLKDLMEPDVAQILQSVALADSLPTKNEISPIDVLIGNDFYLDVILGQKFELSIGVYLMSSKLGWLLAGRANEFTDQCDDVNSLIMSPRKLDLDYKYIRHVRSGVKCPTVTRFLKRKKDRDN